jgi:hypothetical protein
VENNPQPVYQQPPSNVNNGVQQPIRTAAVPNSTRHAPPVQPGPASSSRQDSKPGVGNAKPAASTKATTSSSSAKANGASTAASSSKRTLEDAKPKVKKQDYDEDAFDDDDDDFDEEALMIVQEAEKRIKSSSSATSSSNSTVQPPARRAAPSVQHKVDKPSGNAVHLTSQSTLKPGDKRDAQAQQRGTTASSTSRPRVEVKLQSSNVIDLDDSSDIDELKDELDGGDDDDDAAEEAHIASMLISDSSQGDAVIPIQRHGRATSAAKGRTNAPIEID